MERMYKEAEKKIKSFSMFLPYEVVSIDKIIEYIAENKAISWRIEMQDVQIALPVFGGDDAI
ncbi:MAG: hypothetical protein J7K40_09775 [candidate division Zixibacteria bacterium]|nr:hypothetical protein [candidate division Zixibacteria bacterium]